MAPAQVDFTAAVPDDLLAAMRVDKGGRRIISLAERHEAMEALEEAGCESQASAH